MLSAAAIKTEIPNGLILPLDRIIDMDFHSFYNFINSIRTVSSAGGTEHFLTSISFNHIERSLL